MQSDSIQKLIIQKQMICQRDAYVRLRLHHSNSKFATPSDGYVQWDITFHRPSMGSNLPPLLTDTSTAILSSTCLQEVSDPPPPLTDMFTGILPPTYLQEGSNSPPRLTKTSEGILSPTYLQERSTPPPPLTNTSTGISFSMLIH